MVSLQWETPSRNLEMDDDWGYPHGHGAPPRGPDREGIALLQVLFLLYGALAELRRWHVHRSS